jgi:hypothetical protein
MRMLLILCSSSKLDEMRRLVDGHHLQGYTEIPNLQGSGDTGKHMGTRAWPGTSCLIFAALERDKADALIDDLEKLRATCTPEEGIRVLAMPAEKVI